MFRRSATMADFSRLWRRSPRRTLFLGIAALGVLLWGAVSQFEIPHELVLESLVAMLLVLGAVIVLAGLSVATYIAVRRLFKALFRSHGN